MLSAKPMALDGSAGVLLCTIQNSQERRGENTPWNDENNLQRAILTQYVCFEKNLNTDKYFNI